MSKKRIMLVDDEASITRLMKLNLEATEKYEVRVENKGSLALNAAKEFRPDLVFMDIIMPDMEGSEVARQMRADPVLKDTPIIFLTATITTEEIGSAGGDVGGEAFLAKPVTVRQLVECIKKRIGD
ncbi:MAG: response regulator [Candidatus Omnitrophica bacterium]|nr:response regulator [Candidatus Omnitrophota bacterium]